MRRIIRRASNSEGYPYPNRPEAAKYYMTVPGVRLREPSSGVGLSVHYDPTVLEVMEDHLLCDDETGRQLAKLVLFWADELPRGKRMARRGNLGMTKGIPDIRARLRGEVETDIDEYRRVRTAQALTGVPTWIMQGEPDAQSEAYDYYLAGEPVARIEFEWPYACEVTVNQADASVEPVIFEPVAICRSLEHAVHTVESVLYRLDVN